MIEVSREDYEKLCQLSFDLEALLRKISPPRDPYTDATVATFIQAQDQWQAYPLYLALRPLRMGQVAASMRRLGWMKVKKEAGIFWVKPPAASPAPAT